MRRLPALLGATLGLLLAAPLLPAVAAPGAAAPDVVDGLWTETVPGQPWRATLLRGGVEQLATLPTGALVAETSEGRAVSGDVTQVVGDTAVVATDVPGFTFRVRQGRDRGWRLEVTTDGLPVTRTGVEFVTDERDRFLGLGERSHAINFRGERVQARVLDGPYTSTQTPIVRNFVPAAGFSDRRDATYFPVPWVLSPRGWGVLLDNDEDSWFDFTAPDRWRAEAEADRLEVRAFSSGRPAGALRLFTREDHRQPGASSPAVHGVWWQPSEAQGAPGTISQLDEQRRRGVPISVAQTYTHYLPCGATDRAGDRALTEQAHARGVSITTYINPMMCVGSHDGLYDQGVADDAFTLGPDGRPLVYQYSTATNFDVSQFDFSRAAGRDLFHTVLQQTVEDGYDGWMEDFGEYTPDDAVSADGTPGPTMHNRYVEQYHASARDFEEAAPRPLLRFNRSGWTEAIKESSIVWGGDPTITWGFDGLESSVRQGLSMGLSGVSLWGPDIGGFFLWWDNTPTPELLNRWIQFGAFTGVMRLQAGGIDINTLADRPAVTDPEVAPVWRRYARLRTRLYPYIAGSQDAYHRTGMPLMRAMALTNPSDSRAIDRDDQYLFGSSLLVAPVTEQGATSREVYLPRGTWVDLNRAVRMRANGAYTMRRGSALRGTTVRTVRAPQGRIPVLVRTGAVIPLLPRDVETLSEYDGGLVSLADRADRRELLAFPRRGSTTGPLGTGERLRSQVNAKRWRLVLDADRRRHYTVQASFAGMPAAWRPCRVRVGDRKVAFEWQGRKRVLSFDTRVPADGKVVVRRCR